MDGYESQTYTGTATEHPYAGYPSMYGPYMSSHWGYPYMGSYGGYPHMSGHCGYSQMGGYGGYPGYERYPYMYDQDGDYYRSGEEDSYRIRRRFPFFFGFPFFPFFHPFGFGFPFFW